jgi:hypothetical protein
MKLLTVKKKPVYVKAIKYRLIKWEVHTFCGKENVEWVVDDANEILYIKTLEGNLRCDNGSYIIKGVRGEFYPIRGDIFEETYDIINYETISLRNGETNEKI